MHKITLSQYTKTNTKAIESHKSLNKHNKIPLVDVENHQVTPRNFRKIKPGWWLSLAHQTSFSKSLNQEKMLQEDQRFFTNKCTYVWSRERIFQKFRM